MAVEKRATGDLTQIKIFVGFIAAVIVVIILQQLKNILTTVSKMAQATIDFVLDKNKN